MPSYPSCSTCKWFEPSDSYCIANQEVYEKRLTYDKDAGYYCCDLSIPCDLYKCNADDLHMELDINTFKQTRILEVEIENCVSCPEHQRKSSDLFHCGMLDMDLHYRDISDVTTFPRMCNLVIGSLIKV